MHVVVRPASPVPDRSRTETAPASRRHIANVPPMSVPPRDDRPSSGSGSRHEAGLQMLLRKEVIQPHLPVRLPCYDLVLITDPTFDGSLHKGWATGFGCYRLS